MNVLDSVVHTKIHTVAGNSNAPQKIAKQGEDSFVDKFQVPNEYYAFMHLT